MYFCFNFLPGPQVDKTFAQGSIWSAFLRMKWKYFLGNIGQKRKCRSNGIRDKLVFFGQVRNFWVILRCFKGVFRAMVKITKVLGIGKTPSHHVGKNSQMVPYFFDGVPNPIDISIRGE